MDNKKVVKAWHKPLIEVCEQRLGRELTPVENQFITARRGFIALEVIGDTVKSLEGDELSDYLNSETNHKKNQSIRSIE